MFNIRTPRSLRLAIVIGAALATAASAQSPTSEFSLEPILRPNTESHRAAIVSNSADAEGRFFVTGSVDKTARLWSVDPLRPIGVLRPPIIEGAAARPENAEVGAVESVALSPDGVLVAVGGVLTPARDRIFVFDRITGAIRHELVGPQTATSALAFSRDRQGRYLAAGTLIRNPRTGKIPGAGAIRVWDMTTQQIVAEDHSYDGDVTSVAFSPDALVSTSTDGVVRIYRLQFGSGGMSPAVTIAKNVIDGVLLMPWAVAFAPDNERFAVAYASNLPDGRFDNSIVAAFDGAGRELWRKELFDQSRGGDLAVVDWSRDGKSVWAAGTLGADNAYGRVFRFDASTGSLDDPIDIPAIRNRVSGIRSLPGGKVVITSADPSIVVLDENGKRLRVDGIAQEMTPGSLDLRTPKCGSNTLRLSRDGMTVQVVDARGRGDFLFDVRAADFAAAGETNEALTQGRDFSVKALCQEGADSALELIYKSITGRNARLPAKLPLAPGETARSWAVSPSEAYVAVGGEWTVRLFRNNGEQVWAKSTAMPVWQLNVSADERFLVAALADGTLRWYHLETGVELLSLFIYRESDVGRFEWVMWTPNGFYEASAGGDRLVGWHLNRINPVESSLFYSLDRFKTQFRLPSVGAKVLDEQALPKRVGDTEIRHILPPIVRIVSIGKLQGSALPLTIVLESPSGTPIKAVRATVDRRAGHLISPVPDLSLGMLGKPQNVKIHPLLAFNESLTLEASTADGYGEPVWAALNLREKEKPPRRVGKLFAVIIGVNKYLDGSLSLDWAVSDAVEFKNELLKQTDLYQISQNRIRRLPEDASAQDLRDALHWLSQETSKPGSEDDTAVVFFAGHGVTVLEKGKNKFFFLLSRSETAPLEYGRLSSTALSEDTLLSELAPIAARKLVFLDTCHAGKVTATKLELRSNEFYSDLDDDRRTMVFASAGGQDRSYECSTTKHGCFTAALLDRLRQTELPEYPTEIHGYNLNQWLKTRVPELSVLAGFLRQEPYTSIDDRDVTPIFKVETENSAALPAQATRLSWKRAAAGQQ